MKIKVCAPHKYQSNTYIIYDEKSSEALIIDPGDGAQAIIDFIQKNSLNPTGIILTHHHSDHVGAAAKLKDEFNCPIYIHKEDEKGLKELAGHNILNLFRPKIDVTADQFLNEGDKISAGEIILNVIHTPGHTPGSICLEVVGANVIFTGDTIFANGIGRTDFKGGNMPDMCMSLVNKVNQWPDNTTICPGHGPTAKMAEVRTYNGLFRQIISEQK